MLIRIVVETSVGSIAAESHWLWKDVGKIEVKSGRLESRNRRIKEEN